MKVWNNLSLKLCFKKKKHLREKKTFFFKKKRNSMSLNKWELFRSVDSMSQMFVRPAAETQTWQRPRLPLSGWSSPHSTLNQDYTRTHTHTHNPNTKKADSLNHVWMRKKTLLRVRWQRSHKLAKWLPSFTDWLQRSRMETGGTGQSL